MKIVNLFSYQWKIKQLGASGFIPRRWNLWAKCNVRFKARLVAKGYVQKEGIEYNEVFSSGVKHSSIHILLDLVAQFDLELVQLVNTTFLHGDLDEVIYM